METGFAKKVSSPRVFFRDLSFLLGNITKYIEIVRAKRVTLAFAEKIRLVTSAVNQCVLCTRLHSELAQHVGIDSNEICALLNNDLHGGALADETELTALLYAQHYAESNCNPEPARTRQLQDYYGQKTAGDIVLVIRLINFFNPIGNTLEAFVSRIMGHKSSGSSLLFEILVVLISVPIAVPVFVYTGFKSNRLDFRRERTEKIPEAMS
jgi:AhpD family alkylhydroperoxidase